MIERMLFIGTGGTGGAVLRHTWTHLDTWLRGHGYEGGMPRGWRFVHIDLPENEDITNADVPALATDAIAYVNLAVAPHTYENYDRELQEVVGAPEALAGWRTDPKRAMPLPYRGAGQLRSVGNVVSLARQPIVRKAIAAQVTQLQDPATTSELEDISGRLGLAIPQATADPSVVLVSSLGGGAGAGMFLNVIEIMLAMSNTTPWLKQRLYTVLLTPEALHDDGGARVGDGMEPNSLAAISEFLNAFHHRGTTDPLDRRLFNAGGGGVAAGQRVGRYNFFVGKSNGKLGFAGPPQVAKAIGKALAVLAADDAVRSTFQNYVGENWRGQPITERFSVGDPDDIHNAATALGYANVSLGRDVFARYAGERLARHALDRVLRGHREHDPASTRRDERLISDRADRARETFFLASGLYELGDAHDAVRARFADQGAVDTKIGEAIRSTRDSFSEDRRELTRAQATDEIKTRFLDRAREVVSWADEERTSRMETWVGDVQAQLLDATAASVGTDGFAVTLELLKRLQDQVGDAANALDVRADEAEQRLLGVTRRLHALLERARDRINPRNEAFTAAIDDRTADLADLVDRDLCRFTAAHLRDAADGLIPPLRKAVAAAQTALGRAERGSDRTLVSQWSTRVIAAHLKPADNEILLEATDDFADELDGLLSGLFEGGSVDAESAAIAEVISGRWPGLAAEKTERPRQRLFTATSDWKPASLGVRPAQFTLALEIPGLVRQAEDWVKERQGGLAWHVNENLGSWLASGDRATTDERAKRFLSGLRNAIDLSRPLITIGTEAFQEIHGGALPAPTLAISRIPIGSGTAGPRLHSAVIDTLTRAGVAHNIAEDLCDPHAEAASVEVMSFLGSSVHPAVFTSVTEPILNHWERCTTAAQRRDFWNYRRTRRLTSSVPVSRAVQAGLARGWIIANELGYVAKLSSPWTRSPLDVWSPAGRLAFPAALLGAEPQQHSDVFPALLETLPLAMFRLGRGTGHENDAYRRLLALGGAGDSRELDRWIVHGTFPDPVDAGTEHVRQGTPGADMHERAEAIVKSLTKAHDFYRDTVIAASITQASSLTVDRRWELRVLIAGALGDVIAQVRSLGTEPRHPIDIPY